MFIFCLTLETWVKKSSENLGPDGFQKPTFGVENIFKKPPMIPNLHGSFSVI